MREVKRAEFNEMYLLPPSVEDWLERDHPARFIREFVEAQDLKSLGLDGPRSMEGGSYYDPKLLVMVYLYGYLKKIRSFRGMERACREDVGFIWLSGNQRPDHNAFWRFFGSYRKEIGKLYKQTLRCAMKMKLVGLVLQAVDGTKIQASCSGWKVYDEGYNRKLLEKLNQLIKEQERALESSAQGSEPEEKLNEELKDRKVLREKVQAALKQMEEKELKHSHPQELEAQRMETEGRNRFSYNAQAVVDDKNQIVVAEDVCNEPNDSQQMVPMVQKAENNTGSKVPTLGDGGYASSEMFYRVQEAGFDVITPLPASSQREHDYHASKFRYDKQRDVVICPQNKAIGFFRERIKEGKLVRVYRETQACKNCPVRTLCTKDRHGRSIDIGPYHEWLLAHRQKLLDEAILALLAKRGAIVEPLFAQIKAILGFRRWSFRGLEKVKAQWTLLCSVWNLKVIYRFWRQGLSKTAPPFAAFLSFLRSSIDRSLSIPFSKV